jgi:hypothetical protein
MNIVEIRAAISEIDSNKDNGFSAHMMEDQLQENFISYIASIPVTATTGDKLEGIINIAKEILRTKSITFKRNY